MNDYEKALSICLRAHEEQYRMDQITPYAIHPIMVANSFISGHALKIVALLHDVFEDCPSAEIRDEIYENFDTGITNALECMTKQCGEVYFDYIERVKGNEIARKVKIQDIKHNLSTLPEGGFEGRKSKYKSALVKLEAK